MTRDGRLRVVLALALCLVCAAGIRPGRADFPAEPDSAKPAPALPDSGGRLPPVFQPGNWDSVLAAYDASAKRNRCGHISPEVGARLSKAEGIHLEGGLSVSLPPIHLSRLEGRFGYDFARERPTGKGDLRISLLGDDVVALELAAHSEIAPFGFHNPYGNSWLTLVGGYDARSYMLERMFSTMITWRMTPDRVVGIGWVRARQDPARVVSHMHLFGPNRWLKTNEQAVHLVDNGVRIRFHSHPAYEGVTVTTGLVTTVEATAWGGSLLGGGRRFSQEQADVWYTGPIGRRDSWHLRASGSICTGDAPRQAWQDLGGGAGLKGFPPHGGPADSLIGLSRLVARLEYQHQADILGGTRVPLIKNLGLKLVPFVEAGSVWGARPFREIRTWKDLRLPRREEIRWDLGFGLRKDINYSGLLSHAQLDFAWPMGAQSGPVRISVLLSKNGLD